MDVDNSLFQTTAVCLQNPHLITGLCVPLSVPDWLLTPALLPVCCCCRRFDPVLCKALLSPKPHSECSPISPESSLLLSFASVGTDLFLSYTTVSDFLTQWERWIAIFLGIVCILPSHAGLCLQGPAHPTILKFLPSALRPHDQIVTLASTSVGLLLPQSERVSLLRSPTARSTPDTSVNLERASLSPMPANGIFTSHTAVC